MNRSEIKSESRSLYLTAGLVILIIVGTLLFMVKNTNAAGLPDQTTVSGYYDVELWNDSGDTPNVTHYFVGAGSWGGEIDGFKIIGNFESSTGDITWLMHQQSASFGGVEWTKSGSCTKGAEYMTGYFYYDCNSSNTIDILAGKSYDIGIFHSSNIHITHKIAHGNSHIGSDFTTPGNSHTYYRASVGTHTYYQDGIYMDFYTEAELGESVSMYLPENGLTYKEFESWKVSAENLDVGGGYRFGVQYGLSSSTFPTYTDWSGGMSVSNATMTVGIAKSQDLIPFSVSTSTSLTWWARPILDTGSQYLTGDMIYFLMRIDPGPRPLPTTYPTVTSSTTGFVNQKLKASWDCEPAEDWTDIGGGMRYAFCKTGEFFFVPQDTEYNNFILQKELERAQTIFPFSIVFAVTDVVETSATSTVGDYDLVLSTPWMEGRSIPILTSSTMENAIGADAKNFVFEALENTIWFVTALGVLFLFI